jgi:hypothetical protein
MDYPSSSRCQNFLYFFYFIPFLFLLRHPCLLFLLGEKKK